MSEENIENLSTSDNSFTPKSVSYANSRIKFDSNYLKRDSTSCS